MPIELTIPKDMRKLLAFGSAVGIEIHGDDLEVAVARVRPTGVRVLGRTTIGNFRGRPAAQWGAEYAAFLKALGMGYLSATVLLPRREVIVRQLGLPGVAAKDIPGAIRYQLDSLHPYGEDEICWGWSPVEYGGVLIGIARREDVEHYISLFTEAAILVSSFTFSAAAVHAAIRLDGTGRLDQGFVALSRSAEGKVEVYGESQTRPVFSAEFDGAAPRAASLALSELRLPPETTPLSLEDVLPKPAVNPLENDLSLDPLPYTTALAGACPWLTPAANMLPPEQRRRSARGVFIPTIVLASVALLSIAGTLFYWHYNETQYLHKLQAEISALEPVARHAEALDAEIQSDRERTSLLDQFRSQTRADLNALNELTRLVEPPAWLNNITLNHDTVRISGEAPQAAPLVKILDSSPLFQNTTLDSSNKAAGGVGETFQIHATRRYPTP
jgi:Tfp pilus assembly protein PilN